MKVDLECYMNYPNTLVYSGVETHYTLEALGKLLTALLLIAGSILVNAQEDKVYTHHTVLWVL